MAQVEKAELLKQAQEYTSKGEWLPRELAVNVADSLEHKPGDAMAGIDRRDWVIVNGALIGTTECQGHSH